MVRKDYLNSLDKEYAKFWGCNGECKYYNECKKRLKDKTPKFRQDRARVGEGYGQKGMPKIVCVGIEGFIDEDKLNDEKILTNYLEPSNDACNAHYNGVKYVLAYLLYSFCNKKKLESHIGDVICNEYNWTTSKYCLLNLYKCAFVPNDDPDKTRDLPHTKGMKTHCQEILLSEFEALDPDVIVIQTSQYPDGLWEKLKEKYTLDLVLGDGEDNITSLYKGNYNGKPVLFVFTYHGAYQSFISSDYICNKLNPVLEKTVEQLQILYK